MTAHQAYHHESILSRSIHFDPFRPSGWGWSTKRPQREQILPKGLTLEKQQNMESKWILMNLLLLPKAMQRSKTKIKIPMTHDIVTWSSLHLCSVVTGDNLSKAFFLSCPPVHPWLMNWCCVGFWGAEPTNWEARLRECAQFGSPALRGKAMQGISTSFPARLLCRDRS